MSKSRLLPFTIAVVAASALAGCGAEPDPAGTQPPRSEPAADSTVAGGAEPPAAQEPLVMAAVDDLSDHLGIDPSEVDLVEHQAVTWSDGSLGCPEPGVMYTQALVEGTRTVLSAQGSTYNYHAGADGDPFLCETSPVDPGRLTIPSDSSDR